MTTSKASAPAMTVLREEQPPLMITDRKTGRPPPPGGSTPTCVGGMPERHEPAAA
jgi:hypothetical protein